MIVLTYWQDPPNKKDPDDFDGIKEVRIKTVKEIPNLIKNRPLHCTMISTEHSAERKLRNGRMTNFFKVIWNGNVPDDICPTCGRKK